jgi:hypothetical protein
MPKLGGDSNAIGKDLNHAYKAPTDLSSSTVIDWDENSIFFNTISANKTYTFSNMVEGQTIVFIVKNTGASAITLTFPTLVSIYFVNTVQPGKENIYTFLRCNSKTYVTVIDGMA